MNSKEKISLTKEQETLLIPLYAKAQDNPLFVDPKARQILEAVEYDFEQLNVPQKTEVTLRIRAKKLDAYASEFITAHPNALILHLGCGLDSRCLRVPRQETLWIDLDMPDVIDLRKKFYPETDNYRMIGSSVTDLAWVDLVPLEEKPVFVVAEGLLMYLHEGDVRALILRLHEKCRGGGMHATASADGNSGALKRVSADAAVPDRPPLPCHLVFDAFSKLTADRIKAHPSLQKTGASIHWGIDDPHEIERWGQGIHLKEEWFFSQSPDLDRLSWFYRLMFRLSRGIPAAQRAQRLLYFVL
jgi:O-methyltransferase involved in polyketide biosynthesis